MSESQDKRTDSGRRHFIGATIGAAALGTAALAPGLHLIEVAGAAPAAPRAAPFALGSF